ncbi:MAG: hypothetical protein IJ710_08875 [Prevotella sp.]|nr:hypothetical protein [Prevotella sp.]
MRTSLLKTVVASRVLLILLALAAPLASWAQRFVLTDDSGNKIALATVINENGLFLGYTELDGTLPDTQQSQRLYISHVAYQPVEVDVKDVTGGSIVMHQANIKLDEVQVSPKPVIKMRKFYRVYFWKDNNVYYYRTGFIDYYYNKQTRKQTAKKMAGDHHSRAPWGILNLLPWTTAFERSDSTDYDRLLSGKKKQRLVATGPLSSRIMMGDSIVGTVTKDTLRHQLLIVEDPSKFPRQEEAGGGKKTGRQVSVGTGGDNGRYAVTDKKSKMVVAYRYDGTGNPRDEDLLYRTAFAKYGAHDSKKDKDMQLEFSMTEYTVELEYLTEQEAKDRMKEKMPKMGSKEIEALALQKGVPPLSSKTAALLDALK